MVLADTSIWVDHLRKPNTRMLMVMEGRQLLVHPFVIGELALGGHQAGLARLLGQVSACVRADDEEVLRLIEDRRLSGQGLGYVDVHLLASTLLTAGALLWTLDQKLHAAATRLGLAA